MSPHVRHCVYSLSLNQGLWGPLLLHWGALSCLGRSGGGQA